MANVTLVAVTSVAIEATVEALHKSMAEVQFGEILLLSDRKPSAAMHESISWRQIERLRSRADYSRFMLHELADHVQTSHALCIQWDGYVLSGHAWAPEFLDYDYIGAVWPHLSRPYNVGNGGFSLRSRRLLEACRLLPFDGSESEDVFIARTCRARLEEQGIAFAPEDVAKRFAFERAPANGTEFGFHGAYNLVHRLSREEAVRLFRTLEPQILSRSEKLELFRWALLNGRLKLATAMIKKLLRRRAEAGGVQN